MARLGAPLAAPLGAGLLVSGIGDPGAATLVLSLEPGTKVTYGWSTSIMQSYDGSEQRESPFGQPRRVIEGSAFLLDGQDRDVKGALMRAAAQGRVFLVALPFEELIIVADSTGTEVFVGSTADCDWAVVGQRVVIVGRADEVAGATVQAVTSTSIVVAVVDATGASTGAAIGTAGRTGGRIMPALQALLQPQQGWSRYSVNVGMWALRALGQRFGWANADRMGVGAEILTVNDGLTVPVEELTDDDLMIWDRPNLMSGTVNEAMTSRAEIVDFGALAFAIGPDGASPDWGRSIRYVSSDPAESQWLKAFLWRARGRQVAFLLPTSRPDLVFDSTTTGGFKVKSAAVAGGGDYASWFASPAFRRLALTSASGVTYATITAVTDNLDGTLTLATTALIPEDVTKVSLLELVRFDSDELAVSWSGGTFTFEQPVVTVQDVVPGASRAPFLFDVTVDTGTLTLPIEVKHLQLPLGQTTMIQFHSDRTLQVGAITNTGVGGNQDGMAVCIVNMNNSSSGMELVHEGLSSVATSQLRNAGSLTTAGAGYFSVWYRYHGAISRWVMFSTNLRTA